MDCPTRHLCDYFTSTTLMSTDFCGTIPRPTVKTTNLVQWHGTVCILNVFLLSEREISPNYANIFLDFVHGFGSYVKGLPKTKRCNSVAVKVSVWIRCICETALRVTRPYLNLLVKPRLLSGFHEKKKICILKGQMPFKMHIFFSEKSMCAVTLPEIFRPVTRNTLIFLLA